MKTDQLNTCNCSKKAGTSGQTKDLDSQASTQNNQYSLTDTPSCIPQAEVSSWKFVCQDNLATPSQNRTLA